MAAIPVGVVVSSAKRAVEDVASRDLRQAQEDPARKIARECLQQQLQAHHPQQMGSFPVSRQNQEEDVGVSSSSQSTCSGHLGGSPKDASTVKHSVAPTTILHI